jgi:hypothetical protein
MQDSGKEQAALMMTRILTAAQTTGWSAGGSMATTDSAMDLLISTEMAALAEQMRAAVGIW